jgi:arylsulfatase A-like enzyme
MTTLKELGLDGETIVVIVADHGEEFLEHGGNLHGVTLYNEVTHVPLIFSIPGIPGPRTFDNAVSLVDVMPTVLEVLDIEMPAPADGRSLLPIISGESTGRASGDIYCELSDHLTALIRGNWKLIYDSKIDCFELYDIGGDYREIRNLAGTDSAAVKRLASVLSGWRQTGESKTHIAPVFIKDDKTTRQLKALGYLQ